MEDIGPTDEAYLNAVVDAELRAATPNGSKPALVVITHLLNDRPGLLRTLGTFFEIAHVFGIPYSSQSAIVEWSTQHYPTTCSNLEDLSTGIPIVHTLRGLPHERIVLLDIGGYAAPQSATIWELLGNRFVGVVEGTQSGLRRYEIIGDLKFPVVCLSLGSTKTAESALVGSACVFSVERILREVNCAQSVKNVTILGYGRVGKSVAEACRSRNFIVTVFDTSVERRVQALADGFAAPDRSIALANADLVFGASGCQSWNAEDAAIMRDNAIMVSCSSKDVEFGYSRLSKAYPTTETSSSMHRITIGQKELYVLYGGQPVNFSDGANLGPILRLIQGEMIGACGDLLGNHYSNGIQTPLAATRDRVTRLWLLHYINSATGWYSR
jgi:adenosylhomocysteinase